ncbi:MAG TPA: hypothetical protein VHB73_02825 [Alphaproteobacteria bacterium]|nr:hypothetical protein [Alphaproteobacteria bacterium]
MSLTFKPYQSASLAVSNASSSVLIPQSNDVQKHIRVVNNGSVSAYVKFGGSGVAATTSDMLVLPGTVELFYADAAAGDNLNENYLAGITASGTTSLGITSGEVL